MTEIRTYLRVSTDNPPPTSIDLNAIIDRDQRRGRILRLTGACGGAATAVLAVVVSASLLSSPDPVPLGAGSGGSGAASAATPRPGATVPAPDAASPWAPERAAGVESGAPMPCGIVVKVPHGVYQSFTGVRPDPTERPGDASRRMSPRLLVALHNALPKGSTLRDAVHVEGCGDPLFIFEPERRSFSLALIISDPAGRSALYLTVMPAPTDLAPCAELHSDTCSIRTWPDGTQGASMTDTRAEGRRTATAILARSDGTMIHAQLSNSADGGMKPVTRPELPIDQDALLTLLEASGITLYP